MRRSSSAGKVGDKAPAFALKDQEGHTHEMRDYAGQPLLLYFYPKDDTPGCTKEACSFRDALPKLQKSNAAVLGIRVLDIASKAKFAATHELNFLLLADEDHAVAEKYGLWKKRASTGSPSWASHGRPFWSVRTGGWYGAGMT